MAGIGLELRKLADRGTLVGWMSAYANATVISAGPWIVSIVAWICLNYLLQQILPESETRMFASTVTHVYALSLFTIAPIQFVITRYVADSFFAGRREAIFPSFMGALALASTVALLVGGGFFFALVPARPLYQGAAAVLCVYVSGIYLASSFLSAVQQYRTIALAYFAGFGASVLFSYGLAWCFGLTGAIVGFLLAQLFLLCLLGLLIHREFGSGSGSHFEFVRCFGQFPGLAWCGVFYNFGLWIDKVLFWWFSPTSTAIAGALRFSDYDLAIYLSMLSIAPGMAVFLVRIEAEVATAFKRYFSMIHGARPLEDIMQAKQGIQDGLQRGFYQLLKVQGLVTAIIVLFASEVGNWFRIGQVQEGIFQTTVFGAFLLVIFLAMLTTLFYFDDRRGAVLSTLVFFSANLVFSAVSLWTSPDYYGLGFDGAAALAALVASHRVNLDIQNLEYDTFHRSRG